MLIARLRPLAGDAWWDDGMRTVSVILLLVLAGCGGGSDPSAEPTATETTAKAKPKTAPKPTIAAPTGTPAPEALSRFQCAKDSKDGWRATGTIANDGKSKATYQVTVYVGEATGGDEKARTKQLPDIQAGGSAKFAIAKVPAPKDGGPCHIQVLRR